MQIGAQLYTVRDFCKTPEELAETLKKIAAIGYRTVQVSGTCAFEAEWLRARLQENGLRCVLTHTAPTRLQEETAAVAQEHEAFGCPHVGLGFFSFNGEEGQSYADFVRLYRPVAQALREQGKYFMHHNHAQEFSRVDGKTVMERLAEDFSPEELGFTLDTFWVQAGGGDPAQWLERLSGRVPCIHLKDYAYANDRKMAVVGEGNINFERVFEKAEAAGTRYMLVEQDDCYGENPFDCLRRSYAHLHSLGFE